MHIKLWKSLIAPFIAVFWLKLIWNSGFKDLNQAFLLFCFSTVKFLKNSDILMFFSTRKPCNCCGKKGRGNFFKIIYFMNSYEMRILSVKIANPTVRKGIFLGLEASSVEANRHSVLGWFLLWKKAACLLCWGNWNSVVHSKDQIKQIWRFL